MKTHLPLLYPNTGYLFLYRQSMQLLSIVHMPRNESLLGITIKLEAIHQKPQIQIYPPVFSTGKPFGLLQTAITLASLTFTNCKSAEPTPPEAPVTKTTSFFLTPLYELYVDSDGTNKDRSHQPELV